MEKNKIDRSSAEQEEETKENPKENLSIEEIFAQLDGIIRNLEEGDISLEDSFKYYEAGMKLVKTCGKKIDQVEKQILVLNSDYTEGMRQ